MAESNLKKNKSGYGYKYTDLAQIHEYFEENNIRYYQYVETDGFGNDYIMTVPIIDGKELAPRKGCRVVQATLSGKSNPAQEQGSALTYARRYSLLLAFGLATEDDDAESLTKQTKASGAKKKEEVKTEINFATLRKVLAGKDIKEKFVCSLYKLSRLEDLTQNQYANVMKNLDNILVKQQEEEA